MSDGSVHAVLINTTQFFQASNENTDVKRCRRRGMQSHTHTHTHTHIYTYTQRGIEIKGNTGRNRDISTLSEMGVIAAWTLYHRT